MNNQEMLEKLKYGYTTDETIELIIDYKDTMFGFGNWFNYDFQQMIDTMNDLQEHQEMIEEILHTVKTDATVDYQHRVNMIKKYDRNNQEYRKNYE